MRIYAEYFLREDDIYVLEWMEGTGKYMGKTFDSIEDLKEYSDRNDFILSEDTNAS